MDEDEWASRLASWINATALTTALNGGLLAYALSAFALVVGITMIGSGVTFLSLRKALDRLTGNGTRPRSPGTPGASWRHG